MLRISSSKDILNTYLTLIKPYLNPSENIDVKALKEAYVQFLENTQPHCPHMRNNKLFDAGMELEADFSGYFGPEFRVPEASEAYLPDVILYPDPNKRIEALEKAWLDLKKKDSAFHDLFPLLMNTVFPVHSQRLGGTSVNPSYMGVMCAYYDMTAEEATLPELLIHEFTHNCLFLDELRYRHYQDYKKLMDPDSFVHANYRGKAIKLPFDRCFHSLVVCAEIFLVREAYVGHEKLIGPHPTTDKLIARAKSYLEQIKTNRTIQTLMTDRCQEIVARCDQIFS